MVDDLHIPLPPGSRGLQRVRRVQVDVFVPETGSYTLWMKARAAGLAGTLRVRPQGSASRRVTVPGGRDRNLVVGAEGSVWLEGPGTRSVTIAAQAGAVDVSYLALVRAAPVDAPPGDDRFGRQVHASFRLGRGREGVMLVDPTGAVQDEAPPVDHPPTLTMQREPETLAWRVGLPTPAGRVFRPAPDLAKYPSLSPGPFRIDIDPPSGVEELRYTLDGTVPTAEAPRLDGPLPLTRPTALRLRGYSGGVPVTAVVSRQFWVGPLPPAPTLMLALDPRLITDPEIGIELNDRWRRQQELPDDPALGPLRVTRRRGWARERRQWIKAADLLALDQDGLLFDGRARVRRFTMAVGPGFGLHVRTRDPFRPARDVFGRTLAEPGRSIIVDEDDLNIPAYDVVSTAGGIAPLTRWGLLAVNGEPPSWRVLLEPVDDDLLRSRWGHARFDVLKGKAFAAKRGTTAAYEALAHRLERGGSTAADLAPLIDLPHLTALHFAALFLATGESDEVLSKRPIRRRPRPGAAADPRGRLGPRPRHPGGARARHARRAAAVGARYHRGTGYLPRRDGDAEAARHRPCLSPGLPAVCGADDESRADAWLVGSESPGGRGAGRSEARRAGGAILSRAAGVSRPLACPRPRSSSAARRPRRHSGAWGRHDRRVRASWPVPGPLLRGWHARGRRSSGGARHVPALHGERAKRAGPVLRVPVTEDLEIVARFGD